MKFFVVGHGESEGYRGDISSYDIFMRDLLQHIKIMKEKYSDLPLHLFGHSLVSRFWPSYKQLIKVQEKKLK